MSQKENNVAATDASTSQYCVTTDSKRSRIDTDRDNVASKFQSTCQFGKDDLSGELWFGKYGGIGNDIKNLFERSKAVLKPYCVRIAAYDMRVADDLVMLDSCREEPSDGRLPSPCQGVTDRNQHIVLVGNDTGVENLDAIINTLGEVTEDHRLASPCQGVGDTNQAAIVSPFQSVENDIRAEDDVIIISDDKEPGNHIPVSPCQNASSDNYLLASEEAYVPKKTSTSEFPGSTSELDVEEAKGVYVGVEYDSADEYNQQADMDNGLGELWQEFTFVVESSKEISFNPTPDEPVEEDKKDDCDHSPFLHDDLGYVCRICGLVQKDIRSIIEYRLPKKTSKRTYRYEDPDPKDEDSEIFGAEMRLPGQESVVSEVLSIHPSHSNIMKPHQLAGFKFLVSNLVREIPGGCILAHAPGSGKTFMVISFIHSFMAKYPDTKPLVVLPKGIIKTWKDEFSQWQVEKILLFDFYSEKARNRSQQLNVLRQWVKEKSILFLGYQQFSSLVCDFNTSDNATSCREILLKYPSLLIMDEGHAPRNENTELLAALEQVVTSRKVLLSGTIYQNNVKEVFTLLKLVCPRFWKLDASKALRKRIQSRVQFLNKGNKSKVNDNNFYEMVEYSLLEDKDLERRATIIQDLRKMTSPILHYYKGDSLDELPGLSDFTVFLDLSVRQKREIIPLMKQGRQIKDNAHSSAFYVHPDLSNLSGKSAVRDGVNQLNFDDGVERLDEKEGVKAKFYLNLLRLCEANGEKLLVFSQYIRPLKFLEALTTRIKGWSPGKQIFMITGDSESSIREEQMSGFNKSSDAKVFFGSIKACGEGISLVGASRVMILDIHMNPSVTRQAIGRAYRPGQVRKVFVYRLVAAGTHEEEDHSTSFRKESMAKLWFEQNEFFRPQDLQMEAADIQDCGDIFFESPLLREDVVSLYKR